MFYYVGICGKPRLADVGGPPFLIPTPQLDKVGLAYRGIVEVKMT